jgi:hypothetical protein
MAVIGFSARRTWVSPGPGGTAIAEDFALGTTRSA